VPPSVDGMGDLGEGTLRTRVSARAARNMAKRRAKKASRGVRV